MTDETEAQFEQIAGDAVAAAERVECPGRDFVAGFARRPRKGWSVWGDEVKSNIVLEAS